MYKNVLQSIENIDIWPIISLAIFFIFFLCMVLWWWHMDKDHISKMSKIPLEDDDTPPDFSQSLGNALEGKSGNEKNNARTPFKSSLKGVLSLLLILVGQPVFAQSSGSAAIDPSMMILLLAGAVILVSVLVLVVSIYLLITLKALLIEEQKQKATDAGVAFVAEPTWWEKFQGELTDAVPVEKEESILLDHEYDGIRELDNHLPPWWKWLFYASIGWAAVYLFVYHIMGALPLPAEEYANEVAAAESAKQARLALQEEGGLLIDENTVAYVTEASALADGEKVFQTNCAACHKADGGGSIGPNLTDEYWLHGGGIKNVFSTVKYGVVEKGMIAWEPVLTPQQMQNVSSYILTLEGTNPAGAKAAQGEIWVPEESEETVESDTTVAVQAMLIN